jgi:hypothetical protein
MANSDFNRIPGAALPAHPRSPVAQLDSCMCRDQACASLPLALPAFPQSALAATRTGWLSNSAAGLWLPHFAG